MKKTNFSAKGFLLSMFLTSVIVSCNSEDNASSSDSLMNNATNRAKIVENSKEGISYAAQFYSQSIVLGKSITIINDYSGENFQIQEILVGESLVNRGYIVTDILTGKFISFADIDRKSDNMTIFDPVLNNTVIYKELIKNDEYLSTNKFDFVNTVDYTTLAKKKRKFIGWGEWTDSGPCGEAGFKTQHRKYYFLGMHADTDYNIVPC